MIAYISKPQIIRKLTNEGLKCKMYIHVLLDENKKRTVVFRRVFFTNDRCDDVAVLSKKIGDIYLYEQHFSFKDETLKEVIQALNSIYQFNITKEYYDRRNKEDD